MNWIRRKATWASGNPLFWGTIALSGIGVMALWWLRNPNGSDLWARAYGLFLQFVGVWTVADNLAEASGLFGKRGLIKAQFHWLLEGIGRRRHAVGMAVATMDAVIVRGRGRATIAADKNASLEERIRVLGENQKLIHGEIDSAFAEIDRVENGLNERIKKEATTRQEAIADMQSKLATVAAGNYGALIWGIVVLAVGMFIATFSQEIAKILAGKAFEVCSTI